MSFKLPSPKQKPIVWLFGGGVVLLLVAGGLWAHNVCSDPERVFWATVGQSLATSGVTVHSVQETEGSKAEQLVQYSSGVNNMSHTITTLSQPGTTIKNESIGTTTSDYTRYISISSNRKAASGKPMDFSKVLGVWAKGDPSAPGQLFSQATFGTGLPLGGLVMPIGNVSHDKRQRLLAQMHTDKVYRVAFQDVKKTKKDGRKLYTYKVSIQPVGYAAMMKAFSQSIGFHQFDQLDPASFNGQSSFTITVTIDVTAHQVVSVTGEGDVTQTYGAYDVPVSVALPKDKDAIPFAELQTRLTQLQQ